MCEHSVFKRQFVFTTDEDIQIGNSRTLTCENGKLFLGEGLPVHSLQDANTGQTAGFILGYPVSFDGYLVNGSIRLPVSHSFDVLTSTLYQLSGSWVCILHRRGDWLVLGDPLHTNPIVFHKEKDIVASSTGLFAAEIKTRNLELVESLDIPNEDNWYPFGLTPYHECRRLLPNHYLHLGDKAGVRHWPPKERISELEYDQIIDTVGWGLRKNMYAFAREKKTYLSLTAGHDSRLLLSCARSFSDKLTCHTIRIPDRGGRVDFHTGQAIARKLGLERKGQHFKTPGEEELLAWQNRVGWCVAGRTWRNVTTLAELESTSFRFAGVGAGVGKAKYRDLLSNTSQAPDPEQYISYFDFPDIASVQEAAREWLNDLRTLNSFQQLNIFYAEQRVGCWGAATSIGHADSAYTVFPFSDRFVIEALLALDEEKKRSKAWMTDIIQSTWPRLLNFPYDRYMGWARILEIPEYLRPRLNSEYLASLPTHIKEKSQTLFT